VTRGSRESSLSDLVVVSIDGWTDRKGSHCQAPETRSFGRLAQGTVSLHLLWPCISDHLQPEVGDSEGHGSC